jgi:exodeoxyribonuclease VII small subunit
MSKQNKTIAEKRAELSELLAWFESDEFSVEMATDKFKEAEALALEIEAELTEAKNTITVLKQRFDEETSE